MQDENDQYGLFHAHRKIDDVMHLLYQIKHLQEKIMADLSKLTPAFTAFATDFATFQTDLTAFLGTLKPEDPAVQAQIDSFTQKSSEMDTAVQAMDASLKPAV